MSKKYIQKFKKQDLKTLRDADIGAESDKVVKTLEELAYSGMAKYQTTLGQDLVKNISGAELESMRSLGLLTIIGEGVKLVERDYKFTPEFDNKKAKLLKYIVMVLKCSELYFLVFTFILRVLS